MATAAGFGGTKCAVGQCLELFAGQFLHAPTAELAYAPFTRDDDGPDAGYVFSGGKAAVVSWRRPTADGPQTVPHPTGGGR